MLTQRPFDLTKDREFILDLGCMGSYESLPEWYRSGSYRSYRELWFSSTLPETFISDLTVSLQDERTIADVWLEDGQPAGFLWVSFDDSPA